jgi:hypothetical protein
MARRRVPVLAALASPGPENSKKRVSDPSQSASWTRPANKWPKAAIRQVLTARLKGQRIEAKALSAIAFNTAGIVRDGLRFQKIRCCRGCPLSVGHGG